MAEGLGGGKIRVVVVDDHASLAHGLQAMLPYFAEEIEVVGIANSVAQAFRQVEEHHPDIVLMDLHLPKREGIEASKRILEQFPGVKVAIFTGSHQEGDVHDAMSIGLSGFLLKDMGPREIVDALRAMYAGESVISPAVVKTLLSYPKPEPSPLDELERELLRLASKGLDNSEIARRVAVSESTLGRQLQRIYKKVGAENRMQAVVYAAKNGLI